MGIAIAAKVLSMFVDNVKQSCRATTIG
ncbi:hypothetical protein NB311A_05253 [Nitrobacter sp. Nb-311A]|nr:hypothetical protein NB311A_05253 [Nitrobacter sp. Nb-311A]